MFMVTVRELFRTFIPMEIFFMAISFSIDYNYVNNFTYSYFFFFGCVSVSRFISTSI